MLTLQMSLAAGTLGPSHELHLVYHMYAGVQEPGLCSAAFPRMLAGRWIRCGEAGTSWDTSAPGSG